MPIQVIDVPSVWDAAAQGAMHGFGIGASAVEDQKRLLQQQKATEIQAAIERDRLKQQADAQARLNEYRQGELTTRQQEVDAHTQAAALRREYGLPNPSSQAARKPTSAPVNQRNSG